MNKGQDPTQPSTGKPVNRAEVDAAVRDYLNQGKSIDRFVLVVGRPPVGTARHRSSMYQKTRFNGRSY